jgi:hypothetical protein
MAKEPQQRSQLEDNLVFPEAFDSDAAWELIGSIAQPSLSAYDNAGRLYIWNPEGGVLHYVSVDRDVATGSLATLQPSAHDLPFDVGSFLLVKVSEVQLMEERTAVCAEALKLDMAATSLWVYLEFCTEVNFFIE